MQFWLHFIHGPFHFDIDFVNCNIIVLNTRASNLRYKYPSTSFKAFKRIVIIQDFQVFLWFRKTILSFCMFACDFQTCYWKNHNQILVACITVDAFFWLLRSATLNLFSGVCDSVFITVIWLSHAWIRFVFSVIIGIDYLLLSMWIAYHVILHVAYFHHWIICHMQPFLRICLRESVVCLWCHCIQVFPQLIILVFIHVICLELCFFQLSLLYHDLRSASLFFISDICFKLFLLILFDSKFYVQFIFSKLTLVFFDVQHSYTLPVVHH